MSLTRALSFSEEILDAAREFMTGRIEVIDPSNVIETPYDPITDTGGTAEPEVLIANRPARIQQLNMPSESASSGEWATKRRVRFQVEILDGDPTLRKGLIVRVLDGAKDPTLEEFRYTISSAINSTQAALRTLECVTEGAA